MPPKRNREESKATDATTSIFKGIVFNFSGTFSVPQGKLSKLVESYGGASASSLNKSVTHFVTNAESVKQKSKATVLKAIEQKLIIVGEQYIHKCIEAGKKLDEKDFILDGSKVDEEEEEEEEQEGGTAKTTTTTTTTTTTSSRPKRVLTPMTQQDDDEEEEESEDEEKKTATKTRKKAQPEVTSDLEDSDEESEDEENKVTIRVKNGVAVDQYVQDKDEWHVYINGKNVYDATLNQTEIATNNNKFYIIQLLESDKPGPSGHRYKVFNRWGREGLKGKFVETPGTLASLTTDFAKKFYDKTKNVFSNRDKFQKVKGKYDMIELDYSSAKEEPKKEKKKPVTHKKECDLDDRVQDLLKLIFDVKMMKQTLIDAQFDIKKSPLGKLSKKQILKGYEVLKRIEAVLDGKSKENLTDLSSAFYTQIPHVSEVVMRPPPVISNAVMLKQKLSLLESLGDIEIATTLIKESEQDESNILDAYYKKLKAHIDPLDTSSEEFKLIEKYIKNTHQGTTPTIVNIFRLEREGEKQRFEPSKASIGNRKLLWHGSRLTNFVGIISTGLRIAPPEAPVSGYRFGKGIYFADIMSLSSAYCRVSGTSDFCMLLGDVSLGKTADLYKDTYMEKPQPGSHSTLALGRIEPDPKDFHDHPDGFVIPYGKIIDSPYKNQQVSCKEHQYVVYNVDQVNLRYLLHLKN
ncbi:poly(ADP-ribosyl)transferase [Tieghemostelium lacteum]|uniref:Poly [ADP-ribose] polymerase n=1 Tax=Tieghemostelium lacteum TaxID=361077 RepID=A0A151ZK93_TIELA|nr:poly(ADP-ribosyl)transferase [Tieghemostelium lacteum]|eukprot:KYQ94403.1 poly(ADP-ribosyl)transferase [Tieghemostelium lacteum]